MFNSKLKQEIMILEHKIKMLNIDLKHREEMCEIKENFFNEILNKYNENNKKYLDLLFDSIIENKKQINYLKLKRNKVK